MRGSGPNRYNMCEGGLLLHQQYDAVQIGFITHPVPSNGDLIIRSFFAKPTMHSR